jgi:hypothetical protein
MNKNALKKILDHPDRDEIISKLVIGIPPKDIFDWLQAKYTNVSEIKFVIAEKSIKSFQINYLDIYKTIQEDLAKTKTAIATNTQEDLSLTINNLPAYKNMLVQTAEKELDIRQTVKNLSFAIESRLAQVFDAIQEDPRNINTRVDRLLIEYAELFGGILEKYYKFTEAPAENTMQHNVTIQVMDQHISVFYDAIKEVLAQMDLESSLYFMELFNEKINKLKQAPEKEIAPTEVRLAEAKLLQETINKKLNNESN